MFPLKVHAATPCTPALKKTNAAPARNALGLPNYLTTRRGTEAARADARSADTEAAVLAARAGGTGKRKIARQLGVGVSTVTRILAEAA